MRQFQIKKHFIVEFSTFKSAGSVMRKKSTSFLYSAPTCN